MKAWIVFIHLTAMGTSWTETYTVHEQDWLGCQHHAEEIARERHEEVRSHNTNYWCQEDK